MSLNNMPTNNWNKNPLYQFEFSPDQIKKESQNIKEVSDKLQKNRKLYNFIKTISFGFYQPKKILKERIGTAITDVSQNLNQYSYALNKKLSKALQNNSTEELASIRKEIKVLKETASLLKGISQDKKIKFFNALASKDIDSVIEKSNQMLVQLPTEQREMTNQMNELTSSEEEFFLRTAVTLKLYEDLLLGATNEEQKKDLEKIIADIKDARKVIGRFFLKLQAAGLEDNIIKREALVANIYKEEIHSYFDAIGKLVRPVAPEYRDRYQEELQNKVYKDPIGREFSGNAYDMVGLSLFFQRVGKHPLFAKQMEILHPDVTQLILDKVEEINRNV